MVSKVISLLAVACFVSTGVLAAANYADSVMSYSPGIGYATEFGTGIGYTNAAAALGEPSVVTPGQFGGPVDPFNPPYLKEQLVSLGAGGSLTLGFSNPIQNSSSNPFGLDFIIFGHAGFVITNANYSGGGITDGSLLGANSGSSRVWVSADNVNYYLLNPTRAPAADTLFPTDGSGNFQLPVNLDLSQTNFAGQGLAGIRTLYNGSGGGTGYDLSWAQDANGQPVDLAQASFVRVEEVNGVADIDAVAAVGAIPEPAAGLLLGTGLILLVTFTRRNEQPS
jgi:hypothetical protein